MNHGDDGDAIFAGTVSYPYFTGGAITSDAFLWMTRSAMWSKGVLSILTITNTAPFSFAVTGMWAAG